MIPLPQITFTSEPVIDADAFRISMWVVFQGNVTQVTEVLSTQAVIETNDPLGLTRGIVARLLQDAGTALADGR